MLLNKMLLLLNVFVIVRASLIIEFMKYKYLNNIIIFNCNGAKEFIDQQKILHNQNIRSSFQIASCGISCDKIAPLSKSGIVLNADCKMWTSVLECFKSNNIFSNLFTWLIITTDFAPTEKILSGYPIEFNSDVNIARNKDNAYEIYEVYNTGFFSNGIFISNNIGYWNKTLNIKENNRKDLSGVVIKCTIVVTENLVSETLYHFLTHLDPTKGDNVNRLKFYTIIKYLERMFNLRLKIIRINTWGYMRNGSFDGIVRALQHGYAEIGGTPLFFRRDRSQVLDYIAEIWQSKPCFVFRHPKRTGGLYTIYTRPLDATVWFCIMAMIIICGLSLSIMLQLRTLKDSTDDRDSSISLALLCIWSALCQQGMAVNRKSSAIKLLLFITFVLFLTVYQYYNAVVVSTLLREAPKNIRTLEDLLRSNLKVGVENMVYLKEFFKHTTDPVAIELYEKKIATKDHYNFLAIDNGMALVKQGGFAFHIDPVVAYRIMRETFTEREICDIQEVFMFPPQKMSVVLRKNSPYKDLFAYGVRKIFDTGLAHRLKSLWDEPRPACVHTPDSSIFSVSIMEFSTVLLVLLFGYSLAVIILLLEIIIFQNTERLTRCIIFKT